MGSDKRVGDTVESKPLGSLQLGYGPDGTYQPIHAVTDAPTWVVDAAINADYTSAAIDCRGKSRLSLGIVISPTSDPIAILYILGSTGGTVYTPIALELGSVYTNDPAKITHTDDDLTKIVINDPASAATVELTILNPRPWMKIFYDRTSGGSATGLDASYVLD
jgi:hypothetical protein